MTSLLSGVAVLVVHETASRASVRSKSLDDNTAGYCENYHNID